MTWTPIPMGERAFDRGAYHNARGHQQGRRVTQTADPGQSRGQAHEALTAAEHMQSNQGQRHPEARAGARGSPKKARVDARGRCPMFSFRVALLRRGEVRAFL